MSKKVSTFFSSENDSFCMMLKRAEAGDNQALLKVLETFQSEMEYLAGFIKMPKEDSIQEMKTVLIEKIRNGEVWIG